MLADFYVDEVIEEMIFGDWGEFRFFISDVSNFTNPKRYMTSDDRTKHLNWSNSRKIKAIE